MHTHESKKLIFHYNSDLSGDIYIDIPKSDIQKQTNSFVRVSIAGDEILEFVAEFIRQHKITKLEDSSTNEILGIE